MNGYLKSMGQLIDSSKLKEGKVQYNSLTTDEMDEYLKMTYWKVTPRLITYLPNYVITTKKWI